MFLSACATDPTRFSAARHCYQVTTESLLSENAFQLFPAIDLQTLQKFRDVFGASAFVCRYVHCSFSTDGFQTPQLRSKHESQHHRKHRCTHPTCASFATGFSTKPQLNRHNEKYHPVIASKASLVDAIKALNIEDRSVQGRSRKPLPAATHPLSTPPPLESSKRRIETLLRIGSDHAQQDNTNKPQTVTAPISNPLPSGSEPFKSSLDPPAKRNPLVDWYLGRDNQWVHTIYETPVPTSRSIPTVGDSRGLRRTPRTFQNPVNTDTLQAEVPQSFWRVNTRNSPLTPAFSPFTPSHWPGLNTEASPELPWSAPQRYISYSNMAGLQNQDQNTQFSYAPSHPLGDHHTTKHDIVDSGMYLPPNSASGSAIADTETPAAINEPSQHLRSDIAQTSFDSGSRYKPMSSATLSPNTPPLGSQKSNPFESGLTYPPKSIEIDSSDGEAGVCEIAGCTERKEFLFSTDDTRIYQCRSHRQTLRANKTDTPGSIDEKANSGLPAEIPMYCILPGCGHSVLVTAAQKSSFCYAHTFSTSSMNPPVTFPRSSSRSEGLSPIPESCVYPGCTKSGYGIRNRLCLCKEHHSVPCQVDGCKNPAHSVGYNGRDLCDQHIHIKACEYSGCSRLPQANKENVHHLCKWHLVVSPICDAPGCNESGQIGDFLGHTCLRHRSMQLCLFRGCIEKVYEVQNGKYVCELHLPSFCHIYGCNHLASLPKNQPRCYEHRDMMPCQAAGCVHMGSRFRNGKCLCRSHVLLFCEVPGCDNQTYTTGANGACLCFQHKDMRICGWPTCSRSCYAMENGKHLCGVHLPMVCEVFECMIQYCNLQFGLRVCYQHKYL
jgi:hypothetical protein